MHRLFFALWPTERVKQSVIEAALPFTKSLDGRVIRPHNLHMTLHFIGQASEDVKKNMDAAAQAVIAKSFTLELDHLGHFSRAKVFWMGAMKVPAGLIALHKRLGDALAECGYQCDKRPYNPHVSLMRKCTETDIEQQQFSISWPVHEFVLVESVQDKTGVNYRVIEQYPLS